MNERLKDENRILNASRLVFWVLTACKLVSYCQTTRRHIPENSDLDIHCCEKLKAHWDHYVSGIIKNRVATGKNMGPKLRDLCGSGRDGVFHVTREGMKEKVQKGL
jgi:hypothetical protein